MIKTVLECEWLGKREPEDRRAYENESLASNGTFATSNKRLKLRAILSRSDTY